MTKEEAIRILEYPVSKWAMDWDERDDGLSYYDAIQMAVSALRNQLEPNATLTLEELRDLDGEPVWVELPMDIYPAVWGLVNAADGAVWDIQAHLPQRLAFDHYGKTWRAYRRKPEEHP